MLLYQVALGEFGEGGSDALGGLTQVLVAGGVAQADVTRAAEGATGHGGDMGLVQQIEGEVVVVVDDGITVTLAVVIFYPGEGVEGTIGHVELETGDFLQQTNDEVATALKGDTHLLNAILRAVIGGLGSLLGNR